MPRAKPFFIAALLLALTAIAIALAAPRAHAEWPGTPFRLVYGDNESGVVVPLDGKLSGAVEPGYAYSFHVHAEAVFHAYGRYEGASAGIELDGKHRIWAGISVEKPIPLFPPYLTASLVIKLDDKVVWKKELGKTFPGQHGKWDADIIVYYYCNGTLRLSLSGHGYGRTIVVNESGAIPVYIFAGTAGDAKSYVSKPSYGKLEECDSIEHPVNPWGQPKSGINDEDSSKRDHNDKLLVYAVAGLGMVALLALLLPRGGGVVVVRGSRGMFQLVGLLLLLAFAAGAVAAWKLHSAVGGGGGGDTVLIAAAGLGLLLIFLLILSARRQPQVIVVEGR